MIIFLNGPPRVGKDTVGKELVDQLDFADTYKISATLKRMTHGLYELDANRNDHDRFEDCKDEPLSIFRGLTPRQAYINVSELLIKPVHGDDALGRWLYEDHISYFGKGEDGVITDSGFRAEAIPIVEAVGANNCALVRLHRQGCSFKGDSRGYISLSDLGVLQFDVDNNGPAVETARTILTQLNR